MLTLPNPQAHVTIAAFAQVSSGLLAPIYATLHSPDYSKPRQESSTFSEGPEKAPLQARDSKYVRTYASPYQSQFSWSSINH